MKTNKKLKLNTKKVVILSNEQQNSVQGGIRHIKVVSWDGSCVNCTVSADTVYGNCPLAL